LDAAAFHIGCDVQVRVDSECLIIRPASLRGRLADPSAPGILGVRAARHAHPLVEPLQRRHLVGIPAACEEGLPKHEGKSGARSTD
jgi:hypothetical protein